MVFVSTGGLINKEAAHSQQSLNMALDKRLAGVVRGMKLKKNLTTYWAKVDCLDHYPVGWYNMNKLLAETFFLVCFSACLGQTFQSKAFGFYSNAKNCESLNSLLGGRMKSHQYLEGVSKVASDIYPILVGTCVIKCNSPSGELSSTLRDLP